MSEDQSEDKNKEFAEKIWEYFKEHEQLGLEWKPNAFYNPDGDMIEWYNEQDNYYAERVNEFITLYRADEDDRVVGGCIKNIAHIMNPEVPVSPRMD